MKNSAQFNPLVLVDMALTNAKNAGIELDQQQIDMFWKIARSEVADSELQEVIRSASESSRLRNNRQYGHLSCEDVDIDALKAKLSEVIESLSPKV
ncbi:hypothetical protein RMS29_015650 [Agrobacterium rosae]|uniref:Uncharacterized protein n=1 Tax=Agrobacterium rosae TaxID=1972867 RepID=A0AAW9FJR0_9HYPH|nr:hypothetical protein [Agrobacterium rosae]MDX8305659.1 hypothetical protein [Agrobacterium rosae]MDX8333048.1 hypothetical protein [Agrobacterium rosae]